VLAAVGAAAIIGAAIVLSTTPAGAVGLEEFDSCDDLQAHLETTARDMGFGRDDDLGGSGSLETFDRVAGAPASPVATTAGDAAAEQSGGGDGTNTQVEGIDELDILDVLSDGRILAARQDRIVLIDATGEQILATVDVAGSPQITFDDERATLWAVSTDGQSTTLTRSVLDGATFTDTSTWTVAGRLVDLRRNGDRVHLVAVDDDLQYLEDAGARGDDSAVPFDGTSPVPCDQVLHSPLPGGPATTLVATFAAAGELAPVSATEIVGAGDNVLVTDTALYVSTPSFDAEQLVTGIHRFELDGLRLTGSGSVAGRLLNQFSLDEHDGHLRAAVTVGEGGFIGRPMPVEGDGGIGLAEPTDAVSEETPVPPDSAVGDEPLPEPLPLPAPIQEPAPAPTDPLNEIVTFDLDGALDIVGRSARFGHEGETLHGIRFAGDIAYAVTFLQTDPLYVIDLSEPAFPRVLGEIEIPGFSAYLHPISDTQVIGFGPDGEGRTVARLFDISDPTVPQLLDTATIAADSPITYDHHALRTDGERLVVAANDYVSQRPARCGTVEADQAALDELYRQLEEQYRTLEGAKAVEEIPPAVRELEERIGPLSECVYPGAFPQARIVTLTPAGASLGVASIETSASDAQRVLPLADGYLIVGTEITRVGPTGATQAVLG
jgi:uncharacterized secreted protein with C-terminal beta-propeller domain